MAKKMEYEIIVSVPKELYDKMEDNVRIVRCKDCKSFRKDEKTTYCAPMGLEMQPDDYCSYGERKESCTQEQ